MFKKTLVFTFVLFNCLYFDIIAQPVITNAYCPDTGDVFVYWKITDTLAMQPGPAGAGVTWNFNSLPYSLDQIQYDYFQTQASPWDSLFPASNIGAEIHDLMTGTRYEFYYTDSNTLRKTGTRNITVNNHFNGSYKLFSYPMSYGDFCSDTITGTWNDSMGLCFGNVTTTYDGYGTLIIPLIPGGSGSTFTNVARVKIVEDIDFNFGAGFDLFEHTVTYLWIEDNTVYSKSPLLFMKTTDESGVATSHTKTAGFRYQVIHPGMPQLNSGEMNVQVFPNPGFTTCTLLDESCASGKSRSIQMVNTLGEIVYSETADCVLEKKLDVSSLSPGLYFFEIRNPVRTSRVKFIKL